MDSIIWPHRAWERATTGMAREGEVQAWPGSNLGPPNEFVECQPLASEEQDPGLASFVKAQPRGLFGTAAVREGEVRHLIQKVSLSPT